ncbi:MAG: nitrate reductase molybdenum cofactor assembly chaperone [Candidatus Nanopelagicales bacterium]|nr:nitrate reductase molybdenum cofactor assembly chaperone [Candidatus Nanopelagicales bacterium]
MAKMTSEVGTRSQRRAALILASRLFAYPDEALVADLPVMKEVAASLPADWRTLAEDYLSAISGRELLDLQSEYVSIFDMKRRCCLYLTYYLNGDTRRRGMALWRFQETYRMAGWQVNHGELPDFLPVLLEFAAAGSDEELAARELLEEHREGLEVLQAALVKFGSPAAVVATLVLSMLPALTPEQQEAAQRLVAQGPPTEVVGLMNLEPFSAVDESIGARA